jgi:Beta-xylosidase
MKQISVILLFLFISAWYSIAQDTPSFENPVIRGDMADPSIIRVGDTYYATGTSSEWAPFYPVFTSTDLINWEQKGHVFNEKPVWTSHSFWAPELFWHDNKIFCYYTARRKSDNTSYIGVASSEGTSLAFKDHGPIVEYGTEAIDAFVFDDDGQLYLTWKAYGLDRRPIELLGSRLSADGLRLEGEPFSLLKDDERIGLEGQYHFKQGDYYYIIYSAKSCCGPSSDYDVRVARSTDFRGPYEKYEENPVLSGGNGDYISCGHGTAVTTPDGRMFYLSHGYQSGDAFYLGRQPIMHECMVTDDDWVQFKTGKQAVNKHPLPFVKTVQKKGAGFNDDFSGKILKVDWTWNYPYSDMVATLKNGKLLLSGTPIADNRYGTALCLRPQTTDYTYETKISNSNESFKGLTMYGDDKNLLAFGIQGTKVMVKSVKEDSETILFQTEFGSGNPHFKIDVDKGYLLALFYSKDGKTWIPANDAPLDASSLVRWDRVARPGLIHIGKAGEPAGIDYFRLKNI